MRTKRDLQYLECFFCGVFILNALKSTDNKNTCCKIMKHRFKIINRQCDYHTLLNMGAIVCFELLLLFFCIAQKYFITFCPAKAIPYR